MPTSTKETDSSLCFLPWVLKALRYVIRWETWSSLSLWKSGLKGCSNSKLNLAVELYVAFEQLKCISCTVVEQYVIPLLACYTKESRETLVHNCWVMQTSRQQNFFWNWQFWLGEEILNRIHDFRLRISFVFKLNKAKHTGYALSSSFVVN